jgi:hypothetical protein
MKNFLKNFYLLFLILFSGLGIVFFRNSEAIFLVFIIALIYYFAYNIRLTRIFFVLISIWMVYAIINTISISSFHPYIFIYNPILFFAAFVAVKIYGKSLIFKYERIIYILTLISFFFMGWHIMHASSFYKFMEVFNLNVYDDFNVGTRIRYNIGVYNVNHMTTWGLPRNSGFCWEPGPFGSFIVVAMFFNLLRTKFIVINNKYFYVFFLGLLTTQSTTAFIAFFFLLIWLMFNNRVVKNTLIIILPFFAIILFILFTNVSFLQNKILEDFNQTNEIEELIDISHRKRTTFAPGRFASFKITFVDFLNRPFFGYGANFELRWTNQFGADIRPVSGIGNLLAQYGIFGLVLFSIGLFKSSIYFNQEYFKNSMLFAWFFVVISISIGFSIILSPIFLSFYFLPFFCYNINKQLKIPHRNKGVL